MQKSPGIMVVIDIGGTTIRAARFIEQLVDKRVECPTPTVLVSPDTSPELLQQQLVDVVVEIIGAVTGDLPFGSPGGRLPVAMTFSGRVDALGRTVLSAPDIWGTWATVFPLAQAVEERLHDKVEVRIASDVAAAAWRYEQNSLQTHTFALLMVRTGLSYTIRDPQAVEHSDPVLLGHMSIAHGPETFRCTCGGRGHLSAHAAGAGVANVIISSALQNPKSFRSSELFRLAAQRHDRLPFEKRETVLGRHAVRFNVRQHVDEDAWRNMNDRHGELTPGELQRWLFPLLLDTGMFIDAVNTGDSYASSLLDVITEPVVEHLHNYVFSQVEVVALGGGFARALGEAYRNRIAGSTQTPVTWAEGDNLGDMRGAKEHLWSAERHEESVIDLRDSALTTLESAPAS